MRGVGPGGPTTHTTLRRMCTNRASEREGAIATAALLRGGLVSAAEQRLGRALESHPHDVDPGVGGVRPRVVHEGRAAVRDAREAEAGEATPTPAAAARGVGRAAEVGAGSGQGADLEPPGPLLPQAHEGRGAPRDGKLPEIDPAASGRDAGAREAEAGVDVGPDPGPDVIRRRDGGHADLESHDPRVHEDHVEVGRDRGPADRSRTDPRRADRAAGTAVGDVRPEVSLAAVGRDAVAVTEARVAGTQAADTRRAAGRRVGEAAGRATGTAVAAVSEQAGLAAVRRHAVAVGEVRGAGAEHTCARSAGRGGVHEGTGRTAAAAVGEAVGRVDLAAVRRVAIAVAEARVAGTERAGARDAGSARVRTRRADHAAGAAVGRARARVDAAAAAEGLAGDADGVAGATRTGLAHRTGGATDATVGVVVLEVHTRHAAASQPARAGHVGRSVGRGVRGIVAGTRIAHVGSDLGAGVRGRHIGDVHARVSAVVGGGVGRVERIDTRVTHVRDVTGIDHVHARVSAVVGGGVGRVGRRGVGGITATIDHVRRGDVRGDVTEHVARNVDHDHVGAGGVGRAVRP